MSVDVLFSPFLCWADDSCSSLIIYMLMSCMVGVLVGLDWGEWEIVSTICLVVFFVNQIATKD